ncbi:MAG: outer membrane protein assembly factor BamD [Candidatus Acidiferrales bacterium]|jgi:outer membrane protein assembly factor BamD
MPKILSKNQLLSTVLAFSLCASGYSAYGQGSSTPSAQTGSSGAAPPPPPAPAKQSSPKPQTVQKDKIPGKGKAVPAEPSAEPDKVLYDRAMVDLKKSKFIEGRLALQTLINTYPDSEYLAKAKLGVADSYYREGGTSNTTQAVSEYKDFITFFPFLDEAAYAQMQIAMAHYKMMEKADRDRTEADNAEDDFQTFLLKYPQSPLVPKAEQRLRDVQEVLAASQYRVARYYYLKNDFPASAARLVDLSQRYPLFSQSDSTLWMLGDVYSRAKQFSRNEDDKNHWADLAGDCYRRILTNYPLSKLAPDAKARLTAMGMPVPPPDPSAVAEMKKEQLYEKQHTQHAFVRLPMEMLKSMPDVAAAAHSGQPNLTPPDDAVSATDVLKPGAAGPSFTLAMRPSANPGAGAEAADTGTPVEAVPVGSDSSSGAPGNNLGVQIIEAPNGSGGDAAPATPPPPATETYAPPAATDPSAPPTITLQPTTAASAPPSATPEPAASTPQASGLTQATTGTSGTIAPVTVAPEKAAKADSKTESTSKKKKGIHKVIPF